jgi:hypothetical protein
MATRDLAVERILVRRVSNVPFLVPSKVLWIQKAFITKVALVWSLSTAQVGLTMATKDR